MKKIKNIFSQIIENLGFLGVDRLSVCVIMYSKMLNTIKRTLNKADSSDRWNKTTERTVREYCTIYGSTVDVQTTSEKHLCRNQTYSSTIRKGGSIW